MHLLCFDIAVEIDIFRGVLVSIDVLGRGFFDKGIRHGCWDA